MPITPAIFGIESGPLNTVVQLVVLAIVVVWLALAWYTLADARRRLEDPMLVGSAVLASLVFPFLGTVVYMIVRPPEYLDDVRERELEMQAAEARLASLDYQLCPHCDAAVGRDFLRCPHCLKKLRDTCGACAKPLDPDWMICPYCEAEIPGVTPQRRRRRRRSEEDPLSAGTSQPPPGFETHGSGGYDRSASPEYDEIAPPAHLAGEATAAPPGYVDQPTEAFASLPDSGGDDVIATRAPDEGAPPSPTL